MSEIDFAIDIGVKNYCFFLKECSACQKPGQIAISFSLSGTFLPAAQNDDLSKTVDYYAVSLALQEKLYQLDCQQINAIEHQALKVLKDFSPLITDAYLKITALCHGALIVEEGLLSSDEEGINRE